MSRSAQYWHIILHAFNMFQVLPSSWQASLLASPFSSAKQQRSQQAAPIAPAAFGGSALALQDKLRCLAVALSARFQPGTFCYVQVRL